jgi:hypothetical protein
MRCRDSETYITAGQDEDGGLFFEAVCNANDGDCGFQLDLWDRPVLGLTDRSMAEVHQMHLQHSGSRGGFTPIPGSEDLDETQDWPPSFSRFEGSDYIHDAAETEQKLTAEEQAQLRSAVEAATGRAR